MRRWVRRLEKFLTNQAACKAEVKHVLHWAGHFKTAREAWDILRNYDWLQFIVVTCFDTKFCRWDAAGTQKATIFRRATRNASPSEKCAAFRRLWPGQPREFFEMLEGK